MLRVHIDLLSADAGQPGREIACAEIRTIGGDPEHADYHYRLSSDASSDAPAVNWEGAVVEHRRHQSAWALLRGALEDWWVIDGWREAARVDGVDGHVRAILGADGRVLELSRGPWRMARVGPSAWLLLRGGSARGRRSGRGIRTARRDLLVVSDCDAAIGAQPSSPSGGEASGTDSG